MRKLAEATIRDDVAEATLQLSPIDEVAETICTDAIRQARELLDAQDAGLAGLLGHHDFFESFKYGLVSRAAEVLAANDRNVLAVYMYDPGTNADSETGEEMPLDATMHLLLLVSTPSAALHAFIDSLDRALVASLRALPSSLLRQREFILDVNLMTERDVQLRTGYAKLLSSVFAPPLRVWQRED